MIQLIGCLMIFVAGYVMGHYIGYDDALGWTKFRKMVFDWDLDIEDPLSYYKDRITGLIEDIEDGNVSHTLLPGLLAALSLLEEK